MGENKENRLSGVAYPVWEFNYKPERYIHKSWLNSLPNSDIIEKLIENDEKDSSTRLSHFLMSQLGFNGSFYFDFTDPFTQVALWDCEKLEKLIFHTGVVFYGDEISKLIVRDHVLKYRKSLGDELYHFALERALKLNKRNLSILDLPKQMDIMDRVRVSGLVCFNEAVKTLPMAMLKRIVVKLPKRYFHMTLKYAPQSRFKNQPKELSKSMLLSVINELQLSDDSLLKKDIDTTDDQASEAHDHTNEQIQHPDPQMQPQNPMEPDGTAGG